MSTAPRVMFVGLDAASKDLVLPWIDAGLLPNLRALRDAATFGPTVNAPGLYTGSVWPTVWTGVGPGRHGCYYCEQLVPGSYEIGEFLGHDVKREPFWNALGRHGRRLCLFDVPKAPLGRDINGLQIVDWGTHDADVLPCSWPATLIDEVHARHAPSPFRRCDWVMRGATPERDLRAQLLDRVAHKTAIAEDLLAREPWDLFMTAFSESHCVGHQCWHLHDPTHPRHDPALVAAIGDPVRDVYQALDGALGRLLRHAGPETTVIVLLSHGMAAHNDATYLLDDVLRRLTARPASWQRRVLDRTRRAWQTLPLSFTERFRTIAQRVDRAPDVADRSRRSCFAVPTNANCAGIRLNVVGREPTGILLPGPATDDFCARLIRDLHELVDPASGRPLVKEVLRAAELFPGEHASELPDLLVRWHRDGPITGAASDRIGEIRRDDQSTRRTGDHRPEGFFFARGPGIDPGLRSAPVHAEDFAPTIAALLGVELADVDGRSFARST